MSHDVGRYRKIRSNLWIEAPLRGLDNDHRVVAFYCLTGPQSTSVGIFRVSTAVAVEDLDNVTATEFDARFTAVRERFAWRFDAAVRVLWIPTWLRENPPQSPNVVRSWVRLLNNVPDCGAKVEAVEEIRVFLKNSKEAFRDAFASSGLSLPVGTKKSKALAQSIQGAGDQGFQGTGNRRAPRGGDEERRQGIPAEVLQVANEACRLIPDPNNAEGRKDHFWWLWNQKYPNTRPDREHVHQALGQRMVAS